MGEGWKIKVTTLDGAGRPAIFRHFLVFEHDKNRAIALVRQHPTVHSKDRLEISAPVERQTFVDRNIRRGRDTIALTRRPRPLNHIHRVRRAWSSVRIWLAELLCR